MMRSQNLALCALGALTAAALAFSSPQASEAGGKGTDDGAMNARVETLEREVTALKAFTEAQAAAGAELLDALARCGRRASRPASTPGPARSSSQVFAPRPAP